MSDTTFTDKQTTIATDWLNEVNANVFRVQAPNTGTVRTAAQDRALRRPLASDFGISIGTGADDTPVFDAAMLSAAGEIGVLPGTYRISGLAGRANRSIYGAGSNLTTLKLTAGSVANLLSLAAVNDFVLEGVTLDLSEAGVGTSVGFLANGCSRIKMRDVVVRSAPGVSIQILNCPESFFQDIRVESSTDWAMLLDGTGNSRSTVMGFTASNCGDRGLYLRSARSCNVFGVIGVGNRATALWMTDVHYCNAFGVTDINDLVGDATAIDGASIGSRIVGVAAKNCGGHTASIDSTSTGAPVDCHISEVYSDDAGESMGAITDQGTGNQPVNCSIQGTGKNCGRVTPSEAWAISNGVGCWVDGSVTDTLGGMTYAFKEGGLNPSNNRFTVRNWVAGSAGYFSIASSTSGITYEKLERGRTVVVDASYSWAAATDRRLFYYNAALTAGREFTLQASWPGDRVRVVRFGGGASPLDIKWLGSTIKTLAASTWAELEYDLTNWNVIGAGSL